MSHTGSSTKKMRTTTCSRENRHYLQYHSQKRQRSQWSSCQGLGVSLQMRYQKYLLESRCNTVLSVAGLAAALAAASSTGRSKSSNSKMSTALASATELLASYCIELAESAGADKESKEAKRSASISPYEKAIAGSPSPAAFHSEVEDEDLPCVADLLQLTRKGVLRWKHVSVYISKAYQVTIKVKSKHVGGAFSKNNKCILYEVINDSSSWPFRKERENMDLYFGVKTAQGLLEFKCKNKVNKQKWVHGIQNLLQRRSRFEEAENSLRMLNINKSI